MGNKKIKGINLSARSQSNMLRVIYKYMNDNGLDHDTIMDEISEMKCGLSASCRNYIILRDLLGNKIKTH